MLSVSTKTGDKGESGLANGQRLPKDSLIFEVLGTQDELNSWLGVVIAQLPSHFASQKTFLLDIQNQLFVIGAEIARSPKVKLETEALKKLEKTSQNLQTQMVKNWSSKFLYPGGNQVAAFTDVARTVSRRFERLVVRYSGEQPISPVILQYVNRLSDYLYVLRCFINHEEHYHEVQFISSVVTSK
jgi:cob(I)alamin adenosyltransferase